MTGIQQKLATGRGKFTADYPDLGTGPVNYEDSISEEFFAAERKAVFERSWLCVGRMERLPRKGSYFTRELPGRLASIVITRDLDDNVLRLPQRLRAPRQQGGVAGTPAGGVRGQLPGVRLQVPRLALRTRRRGQPHHQRGGVLRPRQEQAAHAAGALRSLGGVHLHQPLRGSGAVAQLPRRGPARHGDVPVPPDDAALRVLHAESRATGSSRSTPCASGTTRRTYTAGSSTRTWPRPRRWCRRSTHTTTTCSGRTC